MKNKSLSHHLTRRSAFTLIEMLVVIGIIGILAALILGGASIANSKMKRAKAEAERDALVTAIQSYKNKKGFYPPDNTKSTIMSPLFYELTGTVVLGGNYKSLVSGDNLSPANIINIFNAGGFLNASADPSEVLNFAPTISKSSRTASFTIPSTTTTYTLFCITIKGPPQINTIDGKPFEPYDVWNYVSTNPTNNPGSYDLWIDVLYSGHTNRISNWSKDPEAL
jgi:prepilin-type N-terminal cleavage/methylation domain-containing protein